MFCIIPYFQVFDLLKKKEVLENRYVQLALYILYVEYSISSYPSEYGDVGKIDQFLDELVTNTMGSYASKIILALTIMKIHEPNTRWDMIDINRRYFLVNKDRIILAGDIDDIQYYDPDNYHEYKVCDTDSMVYAIIDYSYPYSLGDVDISHSYDQLRSIVSADKMQEADIALRDRWDIGHILHGDDEGTIDVVLYILHVTLSQIFSHYHLCGGEAGIYTRSYYTDISFY